MKIIQLLARIEGSGVTRYVIEFNKGLKALGYDAEILAFRTGFKDEAGGSTQTIPDAEFVDFSDETVNRLNKADLVIINSIIDRRAETRDIWIDTVQNKITTKKVIVVNDHKPAGFRAYYGDLMKRPEFWNSFNKICIFSYESRVYKEIRKVLGDDVAKQKYMHLMHPYTWDESIKNNWKQSNEMLRRVCYLGRHAPFKDDARLIRAKDYFWAHDYELEMRGIKRTINAVGTPNLCYEFDDEGNMVLDKDGKKKESPYTFFANNNKWRKENGISKDDPMIFSPKRKKNVIYIFDAYKRDEGLQIIENYPYSCDFYHLDYDECYGDNMEYVVYEIVEHGGIPVLDWNASKACNVYDDGVNTGKSFLDNGMGIAIKKDLSNIEDCLTYMDELIANPDKFNEVRDKCYNICVHHTNPNVIVSNFINEAIN